MLQNEAKVRPHLQVPLNTYVTRPFEGNVQRGSAFTAYLWGNLKKFWRKKRVQKKKRCCFLLYVIHTVKMDPDFHNAFCHSARLRFWVLVFLDSAYPPIHCQMVFFWECMESACKNTCNTQSSHFVCLLPNRWSHFFHSLSLFVFFEWKCCKNRK